MVFSTSRLNKSVLIKSFFINYFLYKQEILGGGGGFLQNIKENFENDHWIL